MSMTAQHKGETIISYSPDEKQWWITGFDPYKQKVKASDLTATYAVTFNNKTMYNDFYDTWGGDPQWIAWNPKTLTGTLEL